MELNNRAVILLDGDKVRKLLSSELGFSKEHRDLNIKRIGYVSSLIVQSGGISIAAPIAPYQQTRLWVREECSKYGGFIEIYLSTSIETCEQRDRKGLYAKARQGLLKQFTGIDDPYEIPTEPEINIDTSKIKVSEAAENIVNYLQTKGYLEK